MKLSAAVNNCGVLYCSWEIYIKLSAAVNNCGVLYCSREKDEAISSCKQLWCSILQLGDR